MASEGHSARIKLYAEDGNLIDCFPWAIDDLAEIDDIWLPGFFDALEKS